MATKGVKELPRETYPKKRGGGYAITHSCVKKKTYTAREDATILRVAEMRVKEKDSTTQEQMRQYQEAQD